MDGATPAVEISPTNAECGTTASVFTVSLPVALELQGSEQRPTRRCRHNGGREGETPNSTKARTSNHRHSTTREQWSVHLSPSLAKLSVTVGSFLSNLADYTSSAYLPST